jgi:hypothetical protein
MTKAGGIKLDHDDHALRVLYIAGEGRSGSTWLARLLAQRFSAFNAGEFTNLLFRPALRQRSIPCSCGKSPADCTFWSSVLGKLDLDTAFQLFPELVRLRSWRRLMDGKRLIRPDAISEFAKLGALIRSVQLRAGARILVDSSKTPGNAELLGRTAEVSVVHLIRDPRAVAMSWSRPKGYLRRHSAIKVAARWIWVNRASEQLAGSYPYVLVRYEDLVRAPEQTIAYIGSELGFAPADADTGAPSGYGAGQPEHMLAGNPDKLSPIAAGSQSAAEIGSVSQRLLVGMLTAPWLARYGYTVSYRSS